MCLHVNRISSKAPAEPWPFVCCSKWHRVRASQNHSEPNCHSCQFADKWAERGYYDESNVALCVWVQGRWERIVISLLGNACFHKRGVSVYPVWVFWTRLLRPFGLWWWVPHPKEKTTYQQGHPSARQGRRRTVSYKCLHLCSIAVATSSWKTEKRDSGADMILPSHAVASQSWQTNRETCVLAERSGRQRRKVKAICCKGRLHLPKHA